MIPEVVLKAILYLDSWLRFRYNSSDLPGLAVGISVAGSSVFKKAYGYTNIERKEQLTTDHVFRIASQSKVFTSTAIMQLAERRLLSIDDPVTDYLPWLRSHRDLRIKDISLRQLMSHSAGLVRDGSNADYWQLMSPFPDVEKLKDDVLGADLVIENNRQMKYSNIGYGLLGLVVEAVSGTGISGYIKENLLQPLNLRSTDARINEAISDRLVTGYTRLEQNHLRKAISGKIDTRSLTAATGMYSTVDELCTFFSTLLPGCGGVLSDRSKKEMLRSQWRVANSKVNEEYGLGCAVEQVGNRRLVGHRGGFPGQSTASFCNEELNTVVVVLTNCIDGDAASIAKGIFGAIDFFDRSSRTTVKRRFNELSPFEGRFLNLWSTTDILQNGDNLVALSPNTWQPFSDSALIEELVVIDEQTAKITKTIGFGSEGELVRYQFDNQNNVESLQYAGMTMWPANRYPEQSESLLMLGSPSWQPQIEASATLQGIHN